MRQMEFHTAVDHFRGMVVRGQAEYMLEILEQITDGTLTLTLVVDGAGAGTVYANGLVVADREACAPFWLRARKSRGFTHTHTWKIFVAGWSGSAMWQNGVLSTSTVHKCVSDWLREN